MGPATKLTCLPCCCLAMVRVQDLNDLASTLAKEAAQDEDTFRRLDQHMGGQQDV